MSNNILFVFEGERTEDIVVNSLQKYIFNKEFIKCAFAGDVYDLYRLISKDEDLDTFTLVRDKNEHNKKTLQGYTRKDFAEIYFFFDYDGHATMAGNRDGKTGDEKLLEMLEMFDNESDRGKMFISYPMVEAIRHIEAFETFKDLTVRCKGRNCDYVTNCLHDNACKDEPHYKQIVANDSIPQLCNINGYTLELWKQVLAAHLSKLNYVINDKFEYPRKIEGQMNLFNSQLDKYINKQCPEVAVLSAFPVFIHDYYGNSRTKDIVSR